MSSEHSLRSPKVEPALLSSEKNGAADLREIVVFVDGLTEGAGILEFAGVLAEEHDAHLIAVFMQPEPTITQPETFVRGTAIVEVIEAHREEVEAIEADHRVLFEDIVPSRNPGGVEILAPFEQQGGCACVLLGPGDRYTTRLIVPNIWPCWSR